VADLHKSVIDGPSVQMPIKLPKGFTRRKSSGNALEEVENPPPQPSFRVFERPSADRKSLSEGNIFSKRSNGGRVLYTPTEEDDNIFAGSENLPPKHRYSSPSQSWADQLKYYWQGY
jgi:hypothetical protein